MDADAHLDVQDADRLDDRVGTRNRGAGADERRDEAVTGRVDFRSAEPLQLMPDDGVVVVEQVAPPAVAERSGPLGGADDVGENDGGQHPLAAETAARR